MGSHGCLNGFDPILLDSTPYQNSAEAAGAQSTPPAKPLHTRDFVEMPELAPLGEESLAVKIKRTAVWQVADTILPLGLRRSEVGALLFIRNAAESRRHSRTFATS